MVINILIPQLLHLIDIQHNNPNKLLHECFIRKCNIENFWLLRGYVVLKKFRVQIDLSVCLRIIIKILLD